MHAGGPGGPFYFLSFGSGSGCTMSVTILPVKYIFLIDFAMRLFVLLSIF